MTTVQAALALAAKRFGASTDTPRLEAEILLAQVLACTRTHLLAWPETTLTDAHHQHFNALIEKRIAGEPLAYLTHEKEFWSRSFQVSSATLIPRPDTETLIEAVLAAFPDHNSAIMLADLGTGSGIIAVTLQLERPHWQIHAVDISQDACTIASNNAHTFGCERIVFHCDSWCNALPSASFEVVVSNPPYLSEAEWPIYASGLQHEPKSALVSGQDGLTALRTIIHDAKRVLKPGGMLFLEHGFLQAPAVSALLKEAGYVSVSTIKDTSGHPRVTKALVSP
ncbi:MAG TPA: peptide chain release factor N(5)-glutamine methyltransferase [Gammaproteobacteria bacterium]|nr:peptide chain release factor N(5)-glutamine methyltransferase [Gammaproteobacteria bacterium]